VSLKLRVLLLSVVSLLSIFVLTSLLYKEAKEEFRQAETLEKSVLLSTKISNLVHELQKERGRTAGYLGSGGQAFKRELLEQRRQTDQRIAELEKYLNKEFVSSLPKDAQEVFLSVILNKLSDLSRIRIKVDGGQVTLQEAINFYTQLNNDLIDSVGLLARYPKNSTVARELLAYADFMYAKEKAGLERAVLSVAFANKKFPTSELFTRFVDLMAQQRAFIKSFELAAPEEVKEYYAKTVKGSIPTLEVENYERLALASPFDGNLEVDPDQWFSTITKKIDLMHTVESYLAKDLLEKIKVVKKEAEDKLDTTLFVSTASAIVILVVAFVTLKVRRREASEEG